MKIINMFFCAIFYIASALVLGVGIYIAFEKTQYSDNIALAMVGICIILLIVGTMFRTSYQFVRKDRMKTIRTLFKLILIIYIITLLWLSLKNGVFVRRKFNFVNSFDEYVDRFNYLANFMPTETIRENLKNIDIDMKNSLLNTLGNIGLFIPFGILVPYCFKSQRKYHTYALNLLLIIIFIELLQILTATGMFDIDDMILNFLGGTIGYAITAIKPLRRNIEKTNFKRY